VLLLPGAEEDQEEDKMAIKRVPDRAKRRI
jgi:hypothetical protein